MFDRRYRALSYRFRTLTNDTEIGTRLDLLLHPFRADEANVPSHATYVLLHRAQDDRPFELRHGRCTIQRADSTDPLVDYVLWDVTREAVERAKAFLVLHAGAVSWKGLGLLLPAPPDSGKTTLTAGLTSAGFAYLSDEAAPIDVRTGRLHPFPRALWMERPSIEMIPRLRERFPLENLAGRRRQYHVHHGDLRPGALGRPCPVRYVVAPAYVRGSKTVLERMSRAETVVLLAENSFNFGRFGVGGLEALRRLTERAECYRLTIGGLSDGVDALADLVGAPVPKDVVKS